MANEIETGATPAEILPQGNPQGATPETPASLPAGATPANPDAPDADESQLPPKVLALLEKLRGTEREYKQLKGTHDAAQKAAEAAQTAAQIEQGKYKELFEAEKAKREVAEQSAQALERERLLDRITSKHKLPDALRSRLMGNDETELEADAAELAKLLIPSKPEAPELDAQKRGSSNGEMTDAERAAYKQRFRI